MHCLLSTCKCTGSRRCKGSHRCRGSHRCTCSNRNSSNRNHRRLYNTGSQSQMGCRAMLSRPSRVCSAGYATVPVRGRSVATRAKITFALQVVQLATCYPEDALQFCACSALSKSRLQLQSACTIAKMLLLLLILLLRLSKSATIRQHRPDQPPNSIASVSRI